MQTGDVYAIPFNSNDNNFYMHTSSSTTFIHIPKQTERNYDLKIKKI